VTPVARSRADIGGRVNGSTAAQEALVETNRRDRADDGPCCYRIELKGELSAGLEEWIDVDSIRTEAGVTVLEVTAVDQAQLHGVLRRLHDLHLRLIGLSRTDKPCAGGEHEET
jgi:hypothetical protein